MISIFGITSIFIVIVSVAVIILHNRIMKRRTPVDTYLAELEELIRQRMEMLYSIAIPGSELHELCTHYIDLDFNSLLHAYPDITNAYDHAEEKYSTTPTALEENAEAMHTTTQALNKAIETYNNYITKSPTEAAMAKILGLKKEEYVHYAR